MDANQLGRSFCLASIVNGLLQSLVGGADTEKWRDRGCGEERIGRGHWLVSLAVFRVFDSDWCREIEWAELQEWDCGGNGSREYPEEREAWRAARSVPEVQVMIASRMLEFEAVFRLQFHPIP